MKAEEIRQLRRQLGCTARDLAYTLDLEPELVHAWEDGEAFPTKRHVGHLQALCQAGPSAVRKSPKRGFRPIGSDAPALLTDPAFARLVEKLLTNPELYRRVLEMADSPAPPTEPTEPAR